MKNENEINVDILAITMKIKETFPELSEYIREKRLKISDDNTLINTERLNDHYNSLDALLKNYPTYLGPAR